MSVLGIYLYIMNYHNMERFKAFIISQFLWVKNSGCVVFSRFLIRSQLRQHRLKACLGLEDPLPRWLTHKTGKLVLAIVWGLRLLHRHLFMDCFSVLPVQWTIFPRPRDPIEEGRSSHVLYNLWNHTSFIHHHFCLFYWSQKPALTHGLMDSWTSGL